MEVNVMDMTTKTTSKLTEVVSSWGFGFEWIATAATEIELSAFACGETEVVHDVTVSSEDVNDVFIRGEFNDFFFASLPLVTKVLLSFNDDVRAEDEVVSLPSEDELVIVVDGEFPDLVRAWWVFGEDGGIAERNGVTVGLSSLELGGLESAWGLEDWLDVQVKVVDVSTITSLKDSEVSSERSVGFECVTAWATEFESSALIGGEAEEIEDVTVSSVEGGEEFVSSELNAFFLDTWVEVRGTEMLATLNAGVWSEDEVISLETEDVFAIVPDSQVADLVGTAIGFEKVFIVEENGVSVSLSSEELVSGWGEWLEAADPWERVNVQVEVVDVSTETSSQTSKVLSVRGLDAEWVATRATPFP